MIKGTLIIANGEIPPAPSLRQHWAEFDRTICADGAANALLDYQMTPSIIIGDLDSVLPRTRAAFEHQAKIVQIHDQETTDLEKALQYAIDHDERIITVTGISGRRLDHTISNLSILERFSQKVELRILDTHGIGRFLRGPGTLELAAKVGDFVSLLPFRKAEGIVTKGLLYPLRKETLEWSVREGQSNSATAELIRVTISSGLLLVFHSANAHSDSDTPLP